MTARRVPGAGAVVAAIAAVTWKRLLRGRSLWVAAVIAALPAVFGALMSQLDSQSGLAGDLLFFEQLVLSVLPPMFMASAIGEEIEDRTITYLWSRPVPRWAVVAGKLIALAPVAMVLGVAGWHLAWTAAFGEGPALRSHAAIGAGAAALSVATAGIAVLVPRHGLPLAICYGLADAWFGVFPATLQLLTVSEHVRTISGVRYSPNAPSDAVLWLLVIVAIWLAVAMWRVRRLEA